MSKILIGRGVTDSNGIATMTEDANGNSIQGYTGTGAGEVDFSAGCTIDGSSFQSETYEVIDAIFRDGGTLSDKNTNWKNDFGTGDLNRLTDYSQVIETSTGNVIYRISQSNALKQFPTSIMIELDVKQVDGANTDLILDLRPDDLSVTLYTRSLSMFNINDNNWHSVQIKATPTRVSSMIDGTEITGKNVTHAVSYWTFGLWTAQTTTEIHFKNLRIYPI